MKKIAYIFILLFCLGFKHINAKAEHSYATQQLSVLNKYENTLKEKFSTSYFNTKDSKVSKKPSQTKKKKRPRGIKTPLYSFPTECVCLIFPNENELIFPCHKFYFFRLFFSNEKRGPPAI